MTHSTEPPCLKKKNLELIQATPDQQPILANLLELYAYDLTEYWPFDIDDNGFYGYKYLPLYWQDPCRFPFLVYVNKKIAGFVLAQKGSPLSDDKEIYDIAEFFIMKKYRYQGIGLAVAHRVWRLFPGKWQVRVLRCNTQACTFWHKTIERFLLRPPIKTTIKVNNENWAVYTFDSAPAIDIS